MTDPYWRYPSSATETDARAAHPGYFPSDVSRVASQQMWSAVDSRGTTDLLQNDVLPLRHGSYAGEDLSGIRSYSAPRLSGLAAGASVRGISPLEDPSLIRRDVPVGIRPGITDIERSSSVLRADGLSADESSILYVDGLPTDCTRREVGHLFRPFIGFKEIRVVHKEPRHSGDKARVLCFVEFSDAKCALTALEALQGYKFDDRKPDAPVLRIQFAKFPFRPASVHDVSRHGSVH